MALAVFGSTLVACKEDNTFEPFAQLIIELEEQMTFDCTCQLAQDPPFYDSLAECQEDYLLPPPIEACMHDVYNEFSDETTPHMNCLVAAERNYSDCIQVAGCMASSSNCYDTYAAAVSVCPFMSYAAESEVQRKCYGRTPEPPFTCASGQQVPQSYKCDYEEDCLDGSDELNCPVPGGF